RVVAGVEEDPPPVVLDKRREAPVPSEAGTAPEGIVQDRDAVGRSWRCGVRGQRKSACQNEGRRMSKSHVANSSQSLAPRPGISSRVLNQIETRLRCVCRA